MKVIRRPLRTAWARAAERKYHRLILMGKFNGLLDQIPLTKQ